MRKAGRPAGAHVDLDRDAAGVEPVDGEGGDASEHADDGRTPAVTGHTAFAKRWPRRHDPRASRHVRARSVAAHVRRPPTSARPRRRGHRRRPPRAARLRGDRAQSPDPLRRARRRGVRRGDAGLLRGQDAPGGPERLPWDALGPGKRRQVRTMAAAWLAETTDRPYSAELRFDAIGVVFDARGKLVALDHVRGRVLAERGVCHLSPHSGGQRDRPLEGAPLQPDPTPSMPAVQRSSAAAARSSCW